MGLGASPTGGDGLAEGDAAVIGRNALVPEGLEVFLAQTGDEALGQEAILKTAAGERDPLEPDAVSHGDGGFDERVVKFSAP